MTGVELSSTSAALARERDVGDVVTGSVLEMPFADDSFDLAVSLDVIEHLDDDLAALRELRRVVAPGGRPAGHGARLRVAVERPRRAQPPPPALHPAHRCSEVAERAGWRQVRTTYFNSLLLPVAILLRVLDRFNRKTTESSLDLWVPPEPFNWLLERPLAHRGARDRPRRAHTSGPLAAGRVPLSASQRSPACAVAPPACRPYASGPPEEPPATTTDECTRKVQARLTRKVVMVTITVAATCASTFSTWASWTST